ncbi:HAD hydrolase family protein [Streptococcus equi subsp. zooepidemicus]|nr:HAD hydrolase family protein [Streptococcus equi subsp. zooepidemicus]
MDGTLLNDRKNVQKTTQKAIQQLKNKVLWLGWQLVVDLLLCSPF